MDPFTGLLPGNINRLNGAALNMTGQQLQNVQDDGVWIITSSFTIFTMTSGFGLLESGRVSSKDEVNIMVKNVIDVIFGAGARQYNSGLSYWIFGFGLTFGEEFMTNSFCGFGQFFFNPDDSNDVQQGWGYASFIFQMSFATTTSTIVSAGMAERVRLKSYIVISFLLTVVHAIPAHWVWSDHGLFYRMGVIDSAGCSVVHLVGGVAGTVATLYLKPRQNRFGEKGQQQMSNPTNAVLGTFMLWWGWLAFNTGSTYGVSHGKWRLAARSAIGTVMASAGGGITAVIFSKLTSKKIQVDMLIDGLLAALVSTTAGCLCINPWQSVVIGSVGALLALASYPVIEKLEIDDPVGVIPVHVIGATWGMLSPGIFAEHDRFTFEVTRGNNGLLYGGGFYLLGIQAITVVTVAIWSALVGFSIIWCLNNSPMGLRLTKYEEQLGADLREHGLAGHNIAKYRLERLTTKSITSVLKAVMRWKAMTKAGRLRRSRIAQASSLSSLRSTTVVDETGNGLHRRVHAQTNGQTNGQVNNGFIPE